MKIAPEMFLCGCISNGQQPQIQNVTSTNCAEADLAFLMAYAIYGQSQNHLLQIQHQRYSFPLYVSLILPEPVC